MTTLAKIAANRANARLSTGPRTPAGKAAAARNAVRHGLLASTPVVAGEDPAAWDRHLAEVTASLAPTGAMERQLAARAALLLWRLARAARFEAAAVSAGLDAALLPPPPADDLFGGSRPTPDEECRNGTTAARKAAAAARRRAADLKAQLALLDALPGRPDDDRVDAEAAVEVLEAAYQTLFDFELDGDPPPADGRTFLAKLGQPEARADRVGWTAGLVRRGLAVCAGFAGEDAGWMAGQARKHLAGEFRRQTRLRRRQERLAAGLAERLRLSPVWRAAQALIPRPEEEARIVRYETHLSRQLAATLRELERLQAARVGRAVAAPAEPTVG